MTTTTRQAITLSALMIAGVAFLASDLHRIAIGYAWNLFQSFWSTFIAF